MDSHNKFLKKMYKKFLSFQRSLCVLGYEVGKEMVGGAHPKLHPRLGDLSMDVARGVWEEAPRCDTFNT